MDDRGMSAADLAVLIQVADGKDWVGGKEYKAKPFDQAVAKALLALLAATPLPEGTKNV